MSLNRRLPAVNLNRFSMIPRADVPRSRFTCKKRHKTTFDTGLLVPLLVLECIPGDSWKITANIFARMGPFAFPIMDDVYFELFGFFTPNRLVWENWVKQMGEQANPTDTISYLTPQVVSSANGFAVCSLGDYFGLPTVGQVDSGRTVTVNALPFRMYNLIWNEWFRNENIQDSLPVPTGAGPDAASLYELKYRNKQSDQYTMCLPWPQKGATAVTMPIGTSAPVIADVLHAAPTFWNTFDTTSAGALRRNGVGAGAPVNITDPATTAVQELGWDNPHLIADLSAATAATINAQRQAIALQQFLEKDARGGTRYVELLQNHFGVRPEDYRLQRPEFIGGGKGMVSVEAVPNQSNSNAAQPPVGALGATGTMANRHSFRYHVMEHGFIEIFAQVSAPKTYQQGIHKMWSRRTRYDYLWPVFTHLGEQAV